MNRLTGLAQTAGILFWIVSSLYALLASQPFVFEQFLKPHHVPAIAWFARYYPWVCTGLLAFYLSSHLLAGNVRRGRARLAFLVTGGIWALVVAMAWLLPPLEVLAPGPISNALILVFLIPAVLVASVDLASAAVDDQTPAPRHASDFVACCLSAVTATAISIAVGLTRRGDIGGFVRGTGTSLLLHLALFTTIFLSLTAARATAALARSQRVELGGTSVLLGAGIFLLLGRTLLPSIMARDSWLIGVAAAYAAVLAAVITARGLSRSTRGDDSVQRLVAALSPRLAASWLGLTGWLAFVTVVAVLFARASDAGDWNFSISNIGVAITWLLVLMGFLRFVRTERPRRPAWLFALSLVVLAANVGWTTTFAETPASREWTSRDPAARVLTDWIRPADATTDAGLVDFLHKNTNVPASVVVAPIEVSLGSLDPAPGTRPHIFLFVIDSLRRDYLGSYNSEIDFTPALDAFARESHRFSRAFTRYGATGLSVPSIWTGGMLLHKQYVRPFYPMNTLAKLLETYGYAQWVAMDNIMETISPPSAKRQALDSHHEAKDMRFCGTLQDIRTRLASRAPSDPPVFAYALPQDIHVAAIARDGGGAIDDLSYGRFHAPVASRIRAFDRCFGAFIDDLKSQQLYDNSIVILTADHGDSLGEGGRMGHAYTIFPEVVQIPLIVHLPSSLAAGLVSEDEGPVFSTDITPTLYALLGTAPGQPRGFFGRPLYRAQGRRPRSVEPAPVMASSYGAVYGALVANQKTLYILDTINAREHTFELDGSGAGVSVSPTSAIRREGQRAIRATVEGIAEFYKFAPAH